MKPLSNIFWIASGISLLWVMSAASSSQAQIVPDGTTPTLSDECTANCEITGGKQAGSNLFHSFSRFNVDVEQQVFFRDPGVANIISRVTGGNASHILGTLGVSGGNANLFLINPKGIIFGANARLNLGGSFVGTTADAIKFGDRGIYSATENLQADPGLLTVAPSALLFNQIAAQPATGIENRGAFLATADGKSLLLVGGNVTNDGGYLYAPSGRIELGGVAGTTSVGLNHTQNSIELSFADNAPLANVALTNGAFMSVAGKGNGSIAINAHNLDITNSYLQAGIDAGNQLSGSHGGDINVNSTGKVNIDSSAIANEVQDTATGNAGGIQIKAQSLSLTNNSNLSTAARGQGNAGGVSVQAKDVAVTNAAGIYSYSVGGNGGDIRINSDSLSLLHGNMNANSFGTGDAGNIFVQAQTVNLGAESAISTTTEAPAGIIGGRGGDVNINAKTVNLSDHAALFTNTTGTAGRAGNVNITAEDTIAPTNSAIFSDTSGVGDAGDTKINTRTLTLINGARVSSSTAASGNAGNIQVAASNVNISGVNQDGLFLSGMLLNTTSSGLFTTTQPQASGRGGNIQVTASQVRIGEGGVLSARTENAASGGNIKIDANTLELINGGQIITSTFDSGSAGNINVNAAQDVNIAGSDDTFAQRAQQSTPDNDGAASGLLAQVRGAKTATSGRIDVTSGNINLNDGGTITTATTSGEGGQIALKANNISLRQRSKITATAGSASAGGNGGNINIDAQLLTAAHNSDITANAFAGNGGNINVTTKGLFLAPDSDITASSERGVDGTVEIKQPETNPSNGLLPPTQPIDIAALIAQGCRPNLRTGKIESSELVVTGRGGMPPTPTEALNSDAILADLGAAARTTSQSVAKPKLEAPKTPTTEAQGWVVAEKGEVTLTAQAPMNLNIPWLTPAACNAS